MKEARYGKVIESRRQGVLGLLGRAQHRQGVKKQTSPTQIKGRKVAASKDNPEYIVKSDKSGKIAAHKPDELKKA